MVEILTVARLDPHGAAAPLVDVPRVKAHGCRLAADGATLADAGAEDGAAAAAATAGAAAPCPRGRRDGGVTQADGQADAAANGNAGGGGGNSSDAGGGHGGRARCTTQPGPRNRRRRRRRCVARRTCGDVRRSTCVCVCVRACVRAPRATADPIRTAANLLLLQAP